MPEQHELLRARRGTRVRRALPSAPRQASRSLVRHRGRLRMDQFCPIAARVLVRHGTERLRAPAPGCGGRPGGFAKPAVGSFLEFKLGRYRNLDAASGGPSTSTRITNKALHEFLTLG